MDTLDGLKTVVAVVETGSFTAAGERLGISKGLVSKYINEVESTLSIRLFNRSTRKISLTDAGNHYYQHALKLLENYELMVEEVASEQSSPKGLLRVSSPVAFGEHALATVIPEFSQLYPDLSVELVLNNRAVDMLEENIDIRIKSGRVNDSTLIARKLCQWPFVICAAPSYLKKYGTPTAPDDLSHHACIVDSNLKSGKDWTFLSTNGHQKTVTVNSRLASNNPQVIVNIVKTGGGIGLVALKTVTTELQQGSLASLLNNYRPQDLAIYLIYPHREHLSRKVKCFIEFMLSKFNEDFIA